MGMILDSKVLAMRLPHFIWRLNVKNNQNISLEMPQDLSAKLAALGSAGLEPMPSGGIAVPTGYSKGVLPGLSVSQDGKLSGHVSATQKGAQTLYIAKTSQGKPVALLWITAMITQ